MSGDKREKDISSAREDKVTQGHECKQGDIGAEFSKIRAGDEVLLTLPPAPPGCPPAFTQGDAAFGEPCCEKQNLHFLVGSAT